MSRRFDITPTPLPGVTLVTRKPVGDHRGFFERVFCISDLGPLLHGKFVVQINRTSTNTSGCIRGMHFQHPPHAEMKIVSCLHGKVFDVVVDLRQDSPTYLKWHGEILSGDNHKTLVVPEGIAHGFQTLTGDCEMLYLHTAAYCPEAEDGVNPQDPALAIAWPLPISEISEKDRSRPLLPIPHP